MESNHHGTAYEVYVKRFISHKYKNTWLWNEIPFEVLQQLNIITTEQTTCEDIGCDILAQTEGGEFHFIQCKNYSTIGIDYVITISDLAGFYNFMVENNLTNGIVYYSGRLSMQLLKRNKLVKYINLPYTTCETIKLIPHS